MAQKRKKPTVPKPRDPSWRTRRALGHKRIEDARAYRRRDTRSAERAARARARGEGEGEDGGSGG
jgi:hypothetical protein